MSTKLWALLLSAILLASAVGAFFVARRGADAVVATVYQSGERISSIDLSAVEEGYTFVVGGAVQNTVAVEQGRIRVAFATCPDQTCVRQGWIDSGAVPLVCLPNKLVIQIERLPENGVDTVAG